MKIFKEKCVSTRFHHALDSLKGILFQDQISAKACLLIRPATGQNTDLRATRPLAFFSHFYPMNRFVMMQS